MTAFCEQHAQTSHPHWHGQLPIDISCLGMAILARSARAHQTLSPLKAALILCEWFCLIAASIHARRCLSVPGPYWAVQEQELKDKVEERMKEVYAEIEEAVRSGGGGKSMSLSDRPEADRQLYERLSRAVATCQQGLIERDVEVLSFMAPLV